MTCSVCEEDVAPEFFAVLIPPPGAGQPLTYYRICGECWDASGLAEVFAEGAAVADDEIACFGMDPR